MIKAETPLVIVLRELTQDDNLASGELLLSLRSQTDLEETDRLVLGMDDAYGNPNFDRIVTPFRENEVLTEGSPRVRELFSQAVRDESRHAFMIPTQLRYHATEWVEVKSAKYDGGYASPIQFKDRSVSAKIEYQAFINGKPSRMGTLRILAGPSSISFEDTATLDVGDTVSFTVVREGNSFVVLGKCADDVKLTLLVRGSNVARPADRVAQNQPPVWITGNDLGTVAGPVMLSAIDPEGYAVTYKSENLPAGLTLNETTGELTPDVLSSGTHNFTVDASDGVYESRRVFTLRVNTPPVWQTPAGFLGRYETGTQITIQLEAFDDTDPLVYSLISPLPAGLSMSADGLITGVATADGSFTVRASDGLSQVDRTFSIEANAAPIWVTPAGSIGLWQGNDTVSFQFAASDPDGDPLTFSVTPGFNLPPNLTMTASGLLTGTATNERTFTLRVSDPSGAFVDRSFLFGVNVPPIWVTGSNDVGPFTAGGAFNFQLVATDADFDPLTYSVTAGALPRNALLSSTGLLSGAPVLPLTPLVLEFPISADTLIEVYINGVQTDDFLVNGAPYNPPVSSGSNWSFVAPLDITTVTPADSSYRVTYGSDVYFKSKPLEGPFLTDGEQFVPQAGQTYTVTYTLRKTVKETNGVQSCFRPAFDAVRTADGVMDSAMGAKYGFGYNATLDFIFTDDWVLNQFYTMNATWTAPAGYSTARGRIRVNRTPVPGEDWNNPPLFSNAEYEIKSSIVTVGQGRPPSLVSVVAPASDATVTVITRQIANPSVVVDNIVHQHRPVNSLTNSFTVRASDPSMRSVSRTFTTTTNVPMSPPVQAVIVENQSEYNAATASSGTVIYDVRHTPPHVIVYNSSTSTWERDFSKTLFAHLGYPRVATNPTTGKEYLIEGPRPYSVTKTASPQQEWLFNYNHSTMTKIKAALSKVKANTDDATILFIGDSTTYGGGAGNDTNPVVNSYTNAYPAKAAARVTTVPVSIDSRAGDGASGARSAGFVPMAQYDNSLIMLENIEPAIGSTVGGFIFQSMEDQATLVIRPRKSWDTVEFSYIQGTQPTTNFTLGEMRLVADNVNNNIELRLNAGVEPAMAKTATLSLQSVTTNVLLAVSELTAGETFYTLGWKFKNSQEKRLHFVNAGARAWNSGTSGTVPIGYTREGAGQTWITLNAIQGVWKPDLTFINLGINDYRSGGLGITTAQYKANIQKLIDRAKISGDVILCAPNDIDPASQGSIPSIQFNQALYELATANNVPLIDFSIVIGTYAESVSNGTQRDSLHPNQAGYDLMGSAASEVILDLVSKTN